MLSLFGVKDFNKTYSNHVNKISKLEDMGIEYSDIFDKDSAEIIANDLKETPIYTFGTFNRKSEKATLNAKARLVNYQTRAFIQYTLKLLGVNPNFDTAFYIAHYLKINEVMAEVLEQV
jgi:hypothetical protein